MTPIPVLIVPILNRPDLLYEMLTSIDHKIDKVVIIDNGDVVPFIADANVRVIRPGHNLGVAASWNLGLKVTPKAPWWAIANFDLQWGKGDLARLVDRVDPQSATIYQMLGLAAFAITRYSLMSIGYFDENIHPAYDEDLDWTRRADLIGVPRVEVGFSGTHVGSATIHSDVALRAQNGLTHPANDRYYSEKWGGSKQGGETYTTPFNRHGHIGEWRLQPERLRAQAWDRPAVKET